MIQIKLIRHQGPIPERLSHSQVGRLFLSSAKWLGKQVALFATGSTSKIFSDPGLA